MVYPGIKIKAIKGNTLLSDANFNEIRPYLGIEAVAIHAEVARRIPKANQSRSGRWRMLHLAYP